jgi:hypothetical protein
VGIWLALPKAENVPIPNTLFQNPTVGTLVERAKTEIEVAVRASNRFEQKFLVPVKQIPALRAAMEGYVTTDRNAVSEFGYSVYSVYWDSPSLRFFWEKIDGEKIRRKLRFRTYGSSADVFIEIKQRIDRTVQKRRLVWPLERVTDSFGSEGVGEIDDDYAQHPLILEVLDLCHRYVLRPTVAVSYQRLAHFGIYEPDLRLTFDTRVQYSGLELDIAEPFETGRYVVDPRLSILEVKYSHHVPLWLMRLLTRFELTPVRISKYCTAVDRFRFGGQHT